MVRLLMKMCMFTNIEIIMLTAWFVFCQAG